ncbi:MAG: hypothetical protein H6742_16560 [Alphaproteobacteria bacterium]|nr:hypothetical protein [Alphaproteobacteria bacterium]
MIWLLCLPLWAAGPVEAPRPGAEEAAANPSREADNAAWIEQVVQARHLTAEQAAALQAIVADSQFLGRGNPDVTRRPLTPEQCRERAGDAWTPVPGAVEKCGDPNMVPLYDPATQTWQDATTCIDRFEFPNLPCEYPVVWVRASEAQEICKAVGKRLCDAHEWEGGCQGALGEPDYRYDLASGRSTIDAVKAMRSAHNRAHAADKRWSYGDHFQTGVCAQDSTKTAGCTGGSWAGCGSNHYPAGSFPSCQSPLGVADINGNAAEHMNLPLAPDQRASAGDKLGVTEMKGSWFIWDRFQAHEDWCEWRAPFWHGGRVMDPDSHRNYHLGFRCCADLSSSPAP